MSTRFKKIVCSMMVAVAGGPVSAHHSFAMYEAEKISTVEGIVKEFKWANPHVLLVVTTVDKSAPGETQAWTMELTAPGQLSRMGWTHSTVKAGEKVTVNFRSFRDGRLGGAFVSVTLPSGEEVKGRA